MVNKIYLTQRTDRHVAKRLLSTSAPATYETSFGVWQTPGIDTTHLNFPWGIANDTANNVYICDNVNSRIVKLNSNLAYIDSYSTSSTVGVPYAITYVGPDLYIVGVYSQLYVRIQRITTALVSVRVSGDLNTAMDLWYKPLGIVPSFIGGQFAVCGAALDLFLTTETTSFSAFTRQIITGVSTTWPNLYATTKYNGIVKHSTDGYLYLNNGKQILRVNSSFENVGDSDIISKTIFGLKEGKSGTLLTYNADDQKIMRFDNNLNFVEDVYVDTGSTVALDAYDVMDFVEITI